MRIYISNQLKEFKATWYRDGPPSWDSEMWGWTAISFGGTSIALIGYSWFTKDANLHFGWDFIVGLVIGSLWFVGERLYFGPDEKASDVKQENEQ